MTPPGALVESRYAPSKDWMTSAECSSERRSAISAAAANSNTTTSAYPASAVHATRLKRRVSTWLSRRSLIGLRFEPVAHAAHRPDGCGPAAKAQFLAEIIDRKSTRLNSSHSQISYAVFCLKKKKKRN